MYDTCNNNDICISNEFSESYKFEIKLLKMRIRAMGNNWKFGKKYEFCVCLIKLPTYS